MTVMRKIDFQQMVFENIFRTLVHQRAQGYEVTDWGIEATPDGSETMTIKMYREPERRRSD